MSSRAVWTGWIGLVGLGLVAGVPGRASAQQKAPPGAHAAATAAGKAAEQSLEDLETDRPDITESSSVVGAGLWQLETGVLFQSDRVDPVTTHDLSVPNVLMRIGVGSRLELRISGEGFLAESLSSAGSGYSTGASDLELGFKYKLADQQRAGVDLAVIPMVSTPTGSDAFSSGGFDPTLKVTLARDLPRDFALSGNAIVSSITENGTRFTQSSMSVSLGHPLTAGWSGFWEIYGASALSRDSGRAWLFDTGATHGIGKNLQIDVSVGRGLTAGAPDWFVGAGFAIRGFIR